MASSEKAWPVSTLGQRHSDMMCGSKPHNYESSRKAGTSKTGMRQYPTNGPITSCPEYYGLGLGLSMFKSEEKLMFWRRFRFLALLTFGILG